MYSTLTRSAFVAMWQSVQHNFDQYRKKEFTEVVTFLSET